MHLIKRYANRKLYSMKRSGYVTLDDILTLVSATEQIKVVDGIGNDITAHTLAQAIAAQQPADLTAAEGALVGVITTHLWRAPISQATAAPAPAEEPEPAA